MKLVLTEIPEGSRLKTRKPSEGRFKQREKMRHRKVALNKLPFFRLYRPSQVHLNIKPDLPGSFADPYVLTRPHR